MPGPSWVLGEALSADRNLTNAVLRLKLSVRALCIGAHPLWRAARAARSLGATR
jgi:hypothetical protein